MLATEINNAPAAVALLNMAERDRCYLGPSEAAAEKNGEDSAVAQALYSRDIRRTEEGLRLTQRKPVSHPDSLRLHALHATDSGRHFWCE